MGRSGSLRFKTSMCRADVVSNVGGDIGRCRDTGGSHSLLSVVEELSLSQLQLLHDSSEFTSSTAASSLLELEVRRQMLLQQLASPDERITQLLLGRPWQPKQEIHRQASQEAQQITHMENGKTAAERVAPTF